MMLPRVDELNTLSSRALRQLLIETRNLSAGIEQVLTLRHQSLINDDTPLMIDQVDLAKEVRDAVWMGEDAADKM